jgi:hypothetical protein
MAGWEPATRGLAREVASRRHQQLCGPVRRRDRAQARAVAIRRAAGVPVSDQALMGASFLVKLSHSRTAKLRQMRKFDERDTNIQSAPQSGHWPHGIESHASRPKSLLDVVSIQFPTIAVAPYPVPNSLSPRTRIKHGTSLIQQSRQPYQPPATWKPPEPIRLVNEEPSWHSRIPFGRLVVWIE